jgi:alkanesulfonate monooxygenase SsuD/methylene tetrahydromethanopterin reductase-like flavin-dependent oxidoreductase (luciferase family)
MTDIMYLGIYLNQYRDETDFGYDELLTQARSIEELGFDSVAVGERHFYDEGFLDPWTCMTALGTATESLTIASNILILPVYHPIHAAERIANVDRLTDGRTMWGLAVGYRERELESFGVEMDARGHRFAESIETIKRLLGGERVDLDGDFHSFEDAFVRPTPVQDPYPPLLGGGGGPISIKRAAHRCDGFTASSDPPEELETTISHYRDEVAEAGGDPEEATVALMVNGFVAESTEAAREALEPSLFDLLEKYASWGNPHAERPSWADVEDEIVAGTPAEVAERLRAYADVGVDHVFFRTQFPGMSQETAMDGIELLGDEVLPQL